jgi:prepilin-type N-terminal cleavage/methylation domain-containing protein
MIEMLVVISILGILAGVVTMSMVGLATAAQKRADDAELMTIQSAMNLMMMDQRVTPENVCVSPPGATADMAAFPVDPADENNLRTLPPSGSPAPLYPHYLRKETMSRPYTCSAGGTVKPGGG